MAPRGLIAALALGALGVTGSGCVTWHVIERGARYEQQGHEDLALATYKQVLDVDPDNARARGGWSRVCERMLARWAQQVEVALERGQYTRALELAEHAQQSLPGYEPARALGARTLEHIQARQEDAIRDGDYALALEVAHHQAAFELRHDPSGATARLSALTARWATSLDAQASYAQQRGYLALGALYALKAESLVATGPRAAAARALVREAARRYAARVALDSPQAQLDGEAWTRHSPGLCLVHASPSSSSPSSSSPATTSLTRLSYTLEPERCSPQDACQATLEATLTQPDAQAPQTVVTRRALWASSPQSLRESLWSALWSIASMEVGAQQIALIAYAQQRAEAGLSQAEALAAAALLGPLTTAQAQELSQRTRLPQAAVTLRDGLRDRWELAWCEPSIQ